jgi:hypothetical protein
MTAFYPGLVQAPQQKVTRLNKNEALQIDKKKRNKKQAALVKLKLKLNCICCYELLLCNLFISIYRQLTQ